MSIQHLETSQEGRGWKGEDCDGSIDWAKGMFAEQPFLQALAASSSETGLED